MDTEKYIGESPLKCDPRHKLGLVIKPKAITTEKLDDNAVTVGKIMPASVTPEKLSSEVYQQFGNTTIVTIPNFGTMEIRYDASDGMLYMVVDDISKVSVKVDDDDSINIIMDLSK